MLLSDSLDSWCRAHQLTLQLYRFTNGDELISAHRAYGMDLILLDMIMPLLSGMDTARELRQHDPHVPIIFLTSSPEFALESYEVRTFWYLLKPLDEVRFHAVLDSWYESTRLPWLISQQEQIPATRRFIFRMSNIWKRKIRMS